MKIKKVYLGRKQIYPDWWSPGENTLFYFPLKSDLLDYSWNNVSATWWWTVTYQAWSGAYLSWELSINYSTQPTNFTISWYIKNRNSNDTIFAIWNAKLSWWYAWFEIATNVKDIVSTNKIRAEVLKSSWAIWKTSYSATTTTWNHVCMVINWDNNTWYIYINWNLSWSNSISWYLKSTLNWFLNKRVDNQWMYFWDIILESKVRTAQEVADYFNQTKSNYWIS